MIGLVGRGDEFHESPADFGGRTGREVRGKLIDQTEHPPSSSRLFCWRHRGVAPRTVSLHELHSSRSLAEGVSARVRRRTPSPAGILSLRSLLLGRARSPTAAA